MVSLFKVFINFGFVGRVIHLRMIVSKKSNFGIKIITTRIEIQVFSNIKFVGF